MKYKSNKLSDVDSLLEALIDGAGNKNNNCIRQLCANAIGEFTKCRIKNLSADEIENNPIMIR